MIEIGETGKFRTDNNKYNDYWIRGEVISISEEFDDNDGDIDSREYQVRVIESTDPRYTVGRMITVYATELIGR